ncbi:CD209 antigen-like protein 2 isoform X1 [Gambusia affinis]|uniref:CD209 antigen-like protein 2 isoform X1 n=1 Tax=Gambusia affinis TaxID=33528 RepID=UPI001CDCFF54|nr:CD209 antigen-like protein 2 isoform X1 [Gambusia affinis]
MAPAVNRNAAEIDYVNQPDPSTNSRPELETGANHAESGTKLLRVVAVGFGVLCILQVALNVSLRLALNKPQPTPDEMLCGNETRDACELKQQTRQYLQKGWLYFRDSFYYMSSIKKTWPESQEYCQQEDADLVIVNSREEQVGFCYREPKIIIRLKQISRRCKIAIIFILTDFCIHYYYFYFLRKNFITQFSRNRFTWTGLRELAGTDQWIWVDEALLTESYWGPNEPNRLEKENPICVEMRFFDTENSWNDISCTTENFWMCEKEAPL